MAEKKKGKDAFDEEIEDLEFEDVDEENIESVDVVDEDEVEADLEDEELDVQEEFDIEDEKDQKQEQKEQEKSVQEVKKGSSKLDTFFDDVSGVVDEADESVVVGDTGTKVSKYPIEKMKFNKNNRELISIITQKVFIPKRHFHEEVGSFRCFGGACCEHLDLPDPRYVYPIVVYDTDKTGKPISQDVEVKALDVSGDKYDDIVTAGELHGGITTIDLLVTCKDETYQDISFQAAGDARWKKSKNAVKYVVEFWEKNKSYLLNVAGRKITESEFLESLGYDTGTIDENIDMDDVFADS